MPQPTLHEENAGSPLSGPVSSRSAHALGALVRLRRELAGLSRAKVAKHARIAEATLKLLENGHRPSRSTLLRIVNVPELKLSGEEVAPLYGEALLPPSARPASPSARPVPAPPRAATLHILLLPIVGALPERLAACLAELGLTPLGSVPIAEWPRQQENPTPGSPESASGPSGQGV